MKVLFVKSSVLGENSVSNKKIDGLIADYKRDGHEVIVRDVAVNPVPLIDANILKGLQGDESFAKEVAIHNELIEEILGVDEIVIGAPMYNFTMPVQLKAYIDAICRAGKTFKYTDVGAIGLLKAKRALVVSSRGGLYHSRGFDNMEEYMKTVLGFLGVSKIDFLLIEGIALGEGKTQEIRF